MIDFIQSKIVDQENFAFTLNRWRFKNERIVFTNGCFDLLHYGHVHYLATARAMGTKLVIGLNSDESVARLKGDHRPITPVKSRASMLAAFLFVDTVIVFDEDTPSKLIELIKPNVLVKGGDYNIEDIVGADFVKSYGGEVSTIPFIDGHSTTAIESKIKSF